MTIGTGIAIFGIWMFPTAAGFTKTVNGTGFIASILGALVATVLVCMVTLP